MALRIAAVVAGAAVLFATATVKASAGAVGVGLLAIAAAVAGGPVARAIIEGTRGAHRKTLGGWRSEVGRVDVRRAASVPPEPGSPAAELAEYLEARLAGKKGGHPLVIATGAKAAELKDVVAAACATLGPEVRVIDPLGDHPEDIEAVAQWLVAGGDEKELPAKHNRSDPTLFRLGDIERYRDTGLDPSAFEGWRGARHPRLALATDRTRSRGDGGWLDEIYGNAHVMSVLGGSASGRRAAV